MTIYSVQSGDWEEPETWLGNTVPDLSVDDVVIVDSHFVDIDSGTSLILNPGRSINVDVGGILNVYGTLQLQSSELVVDGDLQVNGGSLVVGNGGLLTVNNVVDVLNNATVQVAAGGSVRINRAGDVNIQLDSSLTVGGTVDVFGNLGIDQDSQLNVGNGGLVRIYSLIKISGKMYGGGQIEMVHRGSKILDYAGNSLIDFDQAYGGAPAMIV